MSVKLIAYTKPVDSEYGKNIGEFVAYVARVSNPGNQMNHTTAGTLLAYLETKKHWSPFEMANIVLEVVTTRDIARQLLRHGSIRPQEFSQRYAVVGLFSEPKEARMQDPKNRQSSIETEDAELQAEWMRRQQRVIDVSREEYQWALDKGIAKECARVVLPEGLTMSRLYLNGNIRSWLTYFAVRLDPSTQKEHRELAQEMCNVVYDVLQG